MDAREIESLSMLQKGFADLKDANPELAYNVILDILQGINEYVSNYTCLMDIVLILVFRNTAIKQHVQTSRGLFPHKRIIRKSEMTSKGLVVTEELDEVSGLPATSSSPTGSVGSALPPPLESPSRKSPIAELLYMRWLEGLKLKWPNMLSS